MIEETIENDLTKIEGTEEKGETSRMPIIRDRILKVRDKISKSRKVDDFFLIEIFKAN